MDNSGISGYELKTNAGILTRKFNPEVIWIYEKASFLVDSGRLRLSCKPIRLLNLINTKLTLIL